MKLSIRGGASAGLSYFQFMKEIDKKKIKYDAISGTSVGAIFGSLIACGYTARVSFEILCSLKNDRTMRWFSDIENKRGSLFSRIVKGILIAPVVRWVAPKNMENTLKKFLSWELTKDHGTKLFICAVTMHDAVDYLGIEVVKEYIKTKKLNLNGVSCEEMLRKIPTYYFTDNGVYKYYHGIRSLNKITNNIVPLHKAVMSAFWNPLMSNNYIELDGQTVQMLDGGICDNFSVVPFFVDNDNDVYQLSCSKEPKKYDTFGASNTSDLLYKLNEVPKGHFYKTDYTGDDGFFSFFDGNIDEEYKKEATDFIKEVK